MTTYQLSPLPVQKFFDANGLPLALGFLYSYAAGTSTPQATYSSSTGPANANPIQLNARGECALWLDPTLSYKLNLTDVLGNQIQGWPVDNIPGGLSLGALTASLIPTPTNTLTLGNITNSWAQLYLGPNNAPAFDTVTGNIGYIKQTPAELAAGVTPSDFTYIPYDVRRYGVVFDGITDNSTALANANSVYQHSKYVLFDTGGSTSACLFSISPNWALTNGVVASNGNPLLKYTGASAVLTFDMGTTVGVIASNMIVGDFNLDGGSTATIGLYNRGIVRSKFGRIRVLNLASGSNAAFNFNTCILNTYYQPTCTTNEGGLSTPPFYGLFLTGRNTSTDFCSANVFLGPIMEGLTKGIYLDASKASSNIFMGGTSEGHSTSGIEENAGCSDNMFIGMACQNNTTNDWLTAGRDSKWIGGYTNTLVHFTGGACQKIDGGQHNSITIDNTCSGVSLSDLEYAFNSGTLSDSGVATFYRNVRTAAGVLHPDIVPTTFISGDVTVIPYSASMTPNAQSGNAFSITANNGSAFTINAATNPQTGQEITFTIFNTSGGALGAVTWTGYKLATWTSPGNGNNRSITFVFNGSWYEMSRTPSDVPN